MKLNIRQRLLATTIIVGAMISASPAYAQVVEPAPGTPDAVAPTSQPTDPVTQGTTNATGAPIDEGSDIIVTGSRIPQPNLTSTSPITVVSSQEVKLQGTTRVEDLLNSLPQVFASQGSTDANGASGIATVNLRNLGSIRTLVLVNGRRLVPGDPTSPVADLNFIPSAIIKRVDVLTGGASSVYGSDALAGVVNFVMDTNFTGIRLDGQLSFYNHNNRADDQIIDALTARNYPYKDGMVTDGAQKNVTVSIGADLAEGRGHVLAYAGYRAVNAVTQGDRDFSTCGLSGSLDPDVGVACGGSSTSANGRFRRTTLVGVFAGVPAYGATGPSLSVDPNNPNGEFRTYNATRDAFNFNPYNFFQRPDKRYTLGAFAHYEISPAFDPYLEAMFMDDRTKAQIAPSGAFYGTDFFINCNNPFLSAAQRTALCAANANTPTLQSVYIGRRNVEGGGRVDDLRHTDYRIVTGMKGKIADGITYDVYGQLGRALLSERYSNDFSRIRLNRALNVVNTPGGPVCAAALPDANGIVQDANCVPYDIFNPGGVTDAALAYLQTPGLRKGQTTQYVVSGSLTADLGKYGLRSPLATDGIGIAVGAEYRKDKLELNNDISFLTGDLAGQGTPFGVNDAKGSTNVKEVFGEIRVPLLQDRPFFDELTFEGSYRHSSYNLSGSTNAYKLALEYAPTPDVRLRASYNRAVRAPNVLELFSPATVGLFSSANDDPCSGPTPAATRAQCILAGVPSALYGTVDPSPAGQYNQRTAGFTGLSPETSDSYTLGVVLTPRFLPRFNASVDFYSIKIKDVIGTYGADFTLTQCVQSGNPQFCDRINRSADGSLFTGNSFVDNPNANLGAYKTSGIDINAGYRTPLGPLGNLSLDFVGTYLRKFETTPLPGDLSVGKYDCAGFFGDTCGTPLPVWRHKARATFALNKNVSVSTAWRYFSGVDNDLESGNPLLGGGDGTSVDGGVTPRIKAQSYFDLALTATVDKLTWRLGAQNLFDRQPPISPGYSNNGSNTFAQVYDSLGRYIYTSVTLDF